MPQLVDAAIAAATDAKLIGALRAVSRGYSALQVSGRFSLEDPQGPISSRLAFELFAYGEHLHDDLDKAARMAAMPPELQALVRFLTAEYMDHLIRTALQVRHVFLLTQVLERFGHE